MVSRTMSGNLTLVNLDTDSISVRKEDGSEFSDFERSLFLDAVNDRMPRGIVWTDDGYYDSVLVVKAKNYVMRTKDGQVKIKGSALKATYKEAALRQFLNDCLIGLLDGIDPVSIYDNLADNILNGYLDIKDWSSKKTVTESVLNPKRTNERKVLEAIKKAGKTVSPGDKIFVYFTTDGSLKLSDQYDNDHDYVNLLQKLYKTVKVLEPVVPLARFKKYYLKKYLP